MRITPVCIYIARDLNCNVTLYSDDNTVKQIWCSRTNFTDTFLNNPEIISFLFEDPADSFPAIYCMNGKVAYTRFASENGFYLIGPVEILYCDKSAVFTHMLYTDLSKQDNHGLMEVPVSALLNDTLLLYNTLQEKDLNYMDCLQMNYQAYPILEVQNKYTEDTLFVNRENLTSHNPYDQELRMLNSVETGNVEMLKASWAETYPGGLGITAKDPVRNGKNLSLYVIFASARAAIRGGLQPEYVLTFTDTWSQRVEELNDMSILEALVNDVVMTLTREVHQLKTASGASQIESKDLNPTIERCKNYIFAHLHEPLTVQETAKNLGIHPNYLTSLFRKQEGVSLYQYILDQKMDLVKNLLTYSDYSFLEIANYLGFSSQSHLGAQFKKTTGMTLKQYRDKYHKVQFD